MEVKFIVRNLSQDNLPEIFSALFLCDGHVYEVFRDGMEDLKYDPEDEAFIVTWKKIKVTLYGNSNKPLRDVSRFEEKCDFLALGILNSGDGATADTEYIANHREDKKSRWCKEVFDRMQLKENGDIDVFDEGERELCRVEVIGINSLSSAIPVRDVEKVYAVFNTAGVIERLEFKSHIYSQMMPLTNSFGELMASELIYDETRKDMERKIPDRFKGFCTEKTAL